MTENDWNAFVAECQEELQTVERELKEVTMLVQQTSAEVERLMQSNVRAVSRVRQIESQLDTAPREDIKAVYNTMLENQMRLFTMRGQLEKLQSDQRYLERLQKLYKAIISFTPPTTEATSEVNSDMQAMVVNIIEAQERERLRLSRQMHDGPAQSLSNLVLQAEICQRLFDRDPARARVELGVLRDNVNSSLQKIKSFIFELRPMMLDDLGLIPTMKRYAEMLRDAEQVKINFKPGGKDRRFAPHKEVTIFRVVQELVHIARTYNRATEIEVEITILDEVVKVSMHDNGAVLDIDPELTTEDAQRLNLQTLRERIEMLEGTFQMSSVPGRGVQVNFEIPIGKEESM